MQIICRILGTDHWSGMKGQHQLTHGSSPPAWATSTDPCGESRHSGWGRGWKQTNVGSRTSPTIFWLCGPAAVA